MPKKKYLVTLDDAEREQLEQLLHSGPHATRKVTRARILFKAAEGWDDSAITDALSVGRATVERLCQRFVDEGLGALAERPRPGLPPKPDEKAEARRIAEACRAAPEGRQRCKPRHDILATSGNLSRLDIAGENPRLAHPIFPSTIRS